MEIYDEELPFPQSDKYYVPDPYKRGGKYLEDIAVSLGLNRSADLDEICSVLKAKADVGDPQAMFKLGIISINEKCSKYSSVMDACKYFLRSAESGFAPAQIITGDNYMLGIGTERDEAKAALWYWNAASRGLTCDIETVNEVSYNDDPDVAYIYRYRKHYYPDKYDFWFEDFDPDDNEFEYYEEENLARTAKWFIRRYGRKPYSWGEVEWRLEEGFDKLSSEILFYYADYHFYHIGYKQAVKYFILSALSGVKEAQKLLGWMFYSMPVDEDDKDILTFHDIVEKHGWIEEEYPEVII